MSNYNSVHQYMICASFSDWLLLILSEIFVHSILLCLSYGLGAAAEIPGNLAQGAAGIAVAAFLTPALMNSHEIREMVEKRFGGSLPAFVAAFSRQKDLTDTEIDEIQRMIDRFREEKR